MGKVPKQGSDDELKRTHIFSFGNLNSRQRIKKFLVGGGKDCEREAETKIHKE